MNVQTITTTSRRIVQDRLPRGIQNWIIAAILVALALVPLFADPFTVRMATLAAIGAILALSLNLLYGFAGQISFGHGGFYALGAYGAAIACKYLIPDMAVAVPVAIVVTVVIGSVMGAPVLRLRDHFLGLATLALGLVIYTVLNQWIEVTGGPSGMSIAPTQLFGLKLDSTAYHLLVVVIVAIVVVGISTLVNSKVGWALRALKADEAAAASVGINVLRYKVFAFGISAGIAALGGSLYAFLDNYIAPETFGIQASIMILTMVVVGGLGSNLGAVIGGALFISLPTLFIEIQEYQQLIYGLVLLLFILFLPGGIAGRQVRKG